MQLNNNQCSDFIETSQMICSGNQLTGLYKMRTLVVMFFALQSYPWSSVELDPATLFLRIALLLLLVLLLFAR